MKGIKSTVILLFCLAAIPAFAQLGGPPPPDGPPPGDEKREQIEAMKVAFLTKRLDLTPQEAQQFWPVYNQFQDELNNIREGHRKEMKNARENFDEMADKDVEKLVDNEMVFRQSELDIFKKYNVQFKKVLPIKKVAKLYKSEEDFKRELLKKIQERREGNRPDGPGRR